MYIFKVFSVHFNVYFDSPKWFVMIYAFLVQKHTVSDHQSAIFFIIFILNALYYLLISIHVRY